MSHAVMRMFTALEAEGIVKSITQEFQLAAESNEKDYLAVEISGLWITRMSTEVHICPEMKE